ncbi:hypothetical protein L6472_04250 [Prevotella sp. E13-17]|uniref:DUF6621 family protein n=1 Tax=Prevotella sp. E13-17 TaxID=2913616 RepID=UPI001EDC777A|nr:DUF6621 family protein [Prevotella sp. E13-17]UKK51804.1 hypothetical protein L6472_04250 [Prevotella sp. E13-17]
MNEKNFSENIIVVDADFVDKVAFDLIVNFERMIGRRIPQADLPRWTECLALDGGLREGENEVQVVLIHNSNSKAMNNFMPGNFEQLNGQAFKSHLGEFIFSTVTIEPLTTKEQLFADTILLFANQKEVKRIMIIPDDNIYNKVRDTAKRIDEDKRTTVFSMQPMPGGNFRQEILGYSLMAAMGIKGEEIKPDKL